MNLSSSRLSEILGEIYEAPLAQSPWSKLSLLREAMQAKDVVLILRQPSELGMGVTIKEGDSQDLTAESNYITQRIYALDPFVDLPPNQPMLLNEIIDDEALKQHEFYRLCLKDEDIFHILGVDIRSPGGMRVSLRFTRRHQDRPFGKAEKDFCSELVPHLIRALRIHSRISEIESERSVYANVMTQLSVATILLDEQRKVVRTNLLADNLIARKDSLKLIDGRLHLEHRSNNQRFNELIQEVAEAQHAGVTTVARAMAIDVRHGEAPLSMVLRTVPATDRPEGITGAVIAVFISDPNEEPRTSIDLLSELLKLTTAEAKLAVMLANGHSVETVSDELGISRHTARAHLRSIFAKTGVTRQPLLVKLVLKSLASLG